MSHTIVGVPAIGVHTRGQVKIGWSDRVRRESIHSPVIPGRVAGKVEKRCPRVIRVEFVSTADISAGVSQALFFRIEDNLHTNINHRGNINENIMRHTSGTKPPPPPIWMVMSLT